MENLKSNHATHELCPLLPLKEGKSQLKQTSKWQGESDSDKQGSLLVPGVLVVRCWDGATGNRAAKKKKIQGPP